jgi:hypothetical protein
VDLDIITDNIKSIIYELKDPNEFFGNEDFQLVDEDEEFQDLALEEEKAPEFKVEEEEPLRPDLDLIMEKFENPEKIKKSFEIKYQNDDDDEIFIVHDEEDDDQDSLFVNDSKSHLRQSE